MSTIADPEQLRKLDPRFGFVITELKLEKLAVDVCGDYEQEPLPPGMRPKAVDRRASASGHQSL